jgi:hypothetical protein
MHSKRLYGYQSLQFECQTKLTPFKIWLDLCMACVPVCVGGWVGGWVGGCGCGCGCGCVGVALIDMVGFVPASVGLAGS